MEDKLLKKLSLRQKSVKDLAKRVIVFKRTLKQWFYFASLRYLQTHELNDMQEAFLEDFTDFLVEYMDNVDTDEFFKRKELSYIEIK